MREQDFGADPLEAFGGFRSLEYDPHARFPSELAMDGLVRWHTADMDDDGSVPVLYPEIDWKFNQQSMGWAFNQYQAWARSTFTVPASHSDCSSADRDGLYAVTIQCTNVGDFYVDDQRLSGDWYGYGLTRHTLRLAPGSRHTLSVRVVHEVRIFGGAISPPPSSFRCELMVPFPDGPHTEHGEVMVQVVKNGYGGVVVMDAVDGILAGEYISVALRNVGHDRVWVRSVKVKQGLESIAAELKEPPTAISLYPSSHRPIAIRLEKTGPSKGHSSRDQLQFSLAFELEMTSSDNKVDARTAVLETDPIVIEHRSWGEAYKYTFLDFDDTVHYAAAIPPSDPSSQPSHSAPVLVSLHGAVVDRSNVWLTGVEVSQSPFWLTEYKRRERTWIVLPTGRSPWGYDWHGPSIKNVMNAIQCLADALPGVPDHLKQLPGITPDPERLLMAGHSNGGQGAWYFMTHFPDKAIAATPAAGYVNIKQYVSFLGWLSSSHTDAHLRGVGAKNTRRGICPHAAKLGRANVQNLLESAIAEFDNDVHMPNTVGIPTLARTGSADDNVPPLHSRKMVRLGQENAHNLSDVRLSEIHGEGHWFPGVLHDGIMQVFLRQNLRDSTVEEIEVAPADMGNAEAVRHPVLPKAFEITVINPAMTGSRGGIQVEQLRIPYRKGTIKVQVQDYRNGDDEREPAAVWVLRTTNIRRFRLLDNPTVRLRHGPISKLVVDGVAFDLGGGGRDISEVSTGTFVRDGSSKFGPQWQFMPSSDWTETERHRETYGPAIQILEKRVVVVVGTHFASHAPGLVTAADRIAKLVAHDIYLYGRGDVEVVTDEEYLDRLVHRDDGGRTNLVLVGDGHQNSVTQHVLAQRPQEVTIDTQAGYVSIDPRSELAASAEFRDAGTGLLMIRPWGESHLAMVIAGLDAQGLENAARLFPKRTGLLVPDWVVTGPEMPWKGAGGILAAG
ncbi:hypothetical protein EDD11_009566, partial [Mortierella claussenii]